MPLSPEEFFGAPPPPKTADEFFGSKDIIMSNGAYDETYFPGQPIQDTMKKFGMGAAAAWGQHTLGALDDKIFDSAHPQGITTGDLLREAGILPGKDNQGGLIREFNELLARGTALAFDVAGRAPYAFVRGLAETEGPLAPIGGAASAIMEGALQEFVGAAHPRGPLATIDRAHDLGITDERAPGITPNETARRAFAPSPEPSPTNQVILGAEPPAEALAAQPPPDIHTLARQIAPDTFVHYDALAEQKQVLSENIDAIAQRRDEAAAGAEKEILDKVGGVEDRLTKRQAAELAAIREAAKTDTPEMTQLRLQRNALDAQMRDLAPDVSAAYREAQARMPKPPEEAVVAPESPPVVQQAAIAEAAPAPNIQTLSQRRPAIAAETARDLQAAGRPAEEARAAGALIQAYYETRAARFNGALGTARELYDREAPSVVGAEGRQRGQLDLVTNTLRLFPNADASTFIHESAHGWLEDMIRDAAHEQAPADLRADFDALRAWLGLEGNRPTRRQHELFARGFERYMMEGVAPSAKLAGVFAKFKDWLTTIYQTVARLRAPISDDIRGVYDRLLNRPSTEPVIAEERPIARNFAEQHERDVAEITAGRRRATPEQLDALAEQLRSERDRISELLSAELANGRRRARVAGPQPTGEAEGVAGGSAVPAKRGGVQPVREVPPPSTVEISPSGATAKVESPVPEGPNDPVIGGGSRLVDKAGNIRLDNLDAPEDVTDAIRESARTNNDFVPERRGRVTDGQLFDLADALGISADFLENKRVGEAFTAEEIVAARMLLVRSGAKVADLMKQLSDGGSPLELAQAIARHEMIQGKVAQATAEWGRAGHAFRVLTQIEKTTDLGKLNETLKQVTGRSVDQLYQLARLNARGDVTPGQISHQLWNSRNGFQRSVVFYFTNSLLSGPITHSVYVAGNLLRSVIMPAETGVAGLIGGARQALNLGAADRVYLKEAGGALAAIGDGTRRAWRPALDSFYAGQQLPLPGQKVFQNPWTPYTPPWPKMATDIIGFPGKSVAAIHQFSRVMFYEQHLRRLAIREALDAGLNGQALEQAIGKTLNNPSAEMMARAADMADTDMFQRRTPYGGLISWMSRVKDDYPLVNLMFPFVKIGTEIVRETFIKRTLAGLASREVRGQLLGRAGGAAADEAWAKQVVGQGLLVSGALLAASGITTGYGPTEPKPRSEWLLTHIPYSVQIGNLQIPMQGLGPPGKLLQFGADLWETQHHWDGKDGEKLATAYFKAVERAVLDESFFRSTNDVFSAIDEPMRKGVRYVEGIMSGFVPFSAAQNQLGHTPYLGIDPYQKDVEPGVHGIFDAMRSRMIGVSRFVPNRVDMFGEPIPARGIGIERYKDDPTVQWLNRVGVGPGRMDRSIAGVRLTEAQYVMLSIVGGRLGKEMLNQARPSLEGLPRGVQAKMIDNILNSARSVARKQVMLESLGSDNDIIQKAVDQKLELLK